MQTMNPLSQYADTLPSVHCTQVVPGWRGAAGARVGNRQPGMNISATVLCHPVKLGTGNNQL